MTDAQLAVVKQFDEDIVTLLDLLMERRDAAHRAGNIELPFTNERGVGVVHGCRVKVWSMERAYQQAINGLSTLLDDPYELGLRGTRMDKVNHA